MALISISGNGQIVDTTMWGTNGQTINATIYKNRLYLAGNFDQLGPAVGNGSVIDVTTNAVNVNIPKLESSVDDVLPDGSGGWYVAGSFSKIGNTTIRGFVHLNSNLTLDPAWNLAINSLVTKIAIDGTTLYLAGNFTTIGGQTRTGLAAVDITTKAIKSLNVSVSGSVDDMVISGTTLYLGGSFTSVGGQTRNGLASIDLSTETVTSWNPNPNDDVNALALSGTTLFVGGDFTNLGGGNRNRLASFNTSTGALNSFNPSANDRVNELEVSSTVLYVGGGFTAIGGQNRSGLAAITISTGLATSFNASLSRTNGSSLSVSTFLISGTTIYVGGSFNLVGSTRRHRLAQINLSNGTATSFDGGANTSPNCIALAGNKLYVGGVRSMGGVSRRGLASIDLTTGKATSWDPNATHATETPDIEEMVFSGNNAYLIGTFHNIGGQVRNEIAAVDIGTGLATSWNPNTGLWGTNDYFTDIAIKGNTVYVAGSFASLGGSARAGIAGINLSTGAVTTWNPNPTRSGSPPSVSYLQIFGSTMYVIGGYTGIGGQTRAGVAAISTVTGLANNWNPTFNSSPNTFGLVNDTLYCGGNFTQVNGQSRQRLAALDTVNGAVLGFSTTLDNTVFHLHIDGPTIYASGSFNGSFIPINRHTGQKGPWWPGVSNSGHQIAVSRDTLVIAGSFSTFTGLYINNVARLKIGGCPSTPTITASGPTDFCGGTSIVLTSSLSDSYVWSNGQNTRSITVGSTGSYSVRTAIGACFSGTSNVINVNVTSVTRPTVTASGPLSFCSGGSVTLTSSVANAYLWSTGETTQSITVTTAGSYSVQAIGSSCTSSASFARVVTVTPSPTKLTISAGGPTTFCAGGSVLLTASVAGQYIWSTGETGQSITVSDPGNYTVRAISGSCTSDVSDPIVVSFSTSTPTISPNGTTTFCTGGSVTLTAPSATSYLWSNSATTQSINVTTSGSYTVQTIANGCTSAVSAATVVTVNTPPSTPTISAGGPTTFTTGGSVTLSGPAGFSYLWSDGATTQSINVTSTQTYTLRTITGTCTSAISSPLTVTVNPAAGGFVFTGTGNWEDVSRWSGGALPTDQDSATIAPGAVATVSTGQVARAILISPGAVFNNNSTSEPLAIRDMIHNLGTINDGGGRAGFNLSGGSRNPAIIKGNTFTVSVLNVLNAKTETDLVIKNELSTINFDANHKQITLKSTAAATAKLLVIAGQLQNTENFVVERYLAPSLASGGGAWVWVGAQTQGQNVNVWSANNPYATATYNQTSVTGGSISTLDPTYTAAGANGYRKPTGPTQAAPVGVGHRVWFRTVEFFGTGAGVWKTTGSPKIGNHTFPLLYCAGSNCAAQGSATENGWNLIANPYAAPLDWDAAFGWTKTNIFNATYVFRHRFGNTASYINGVGVNGGNRYIPSGQGFMIWADEPTAALSVTPDAIVTTQNPAVQRQGATADVLKLNIQSSANPDLQDQIALRWDATATRGFDQDLEANKMLSATGVNLSFLNGTTPMAILAEHLPTSTTTYPLALTAPQAGTYTISFEGLASLNNPQWSIYLLDNQTGISTLVTDATSYLFNAVQGNNNGRFSLVVNPAGVTSLGSTISNKLLLSPNPASSGVTMQLATPISQATTFRISNALGQVVITATMPANTTELSLDLSSLAKGVYMVQAPGFGVTKLVKE